MCWFSRGRARELILRIEVVLLALVAGFVLATVCYRRGLAAVSFAPHASAQPRPGLSRTTAAPGVRAKTPSRLVPGYTFAGGQR